MCSFELRPTVCLDSIFHVGDIRENFVPRDGCEAEFAIKTLRRAVPSGLQAQETYTQLARVIDYAAQHSGREAFSPQSLLS